MIAASQQLEQALAARDRAAELLQGSEMRARRIIETAGDPFVSMGADGIVEAWNHAAEMTFGWRADEAIGRPLHELIIPPQQRAAHLRGLERMRAGGQASILGQTLELTALRRDGGELPVELTVWAIDDDDRRSFNAFVRDISTRKEAEASTARLAAIVESSTDVITRVSPMTGLVLYVSPSVTSILGWTPDELVGTPFGALVHPEAGPSQIEGVMVSGERFHVRVMRLRCRNGSWLWCETLSRPIVDPTTGATEIQSSVRDISARVAAQEGLRASEERFRLTQLHAPIGMALVDLDGRWLQVNPALCQLVGRPEEELLTLTFGDITHPDDLAEDLGLVEQLLRGDIRSYELEKRYLRPDGQFVHVLLSVSLVDADGEPCYFIAQILDISARRRDEEALKAAAVELEALNRELGILSTTDPLTGTSNRRHLDEVLAAACQTAQRHGDPLAVLLIDIDHFKQVNDHHGHSRGDDVLKIVTRRLASTLRTGDTIGRWGGEEFLVVLPRTDRAAAVALAERLRSGVADDPVPVGDEDALVITVSIGVAAAAHPVPDRLLAEADRAMYAAKEAGRNRVL